MPAPNVFSFGDFFLDVRRRRLMRGRSAVHLKPKEWDLLHYLIERRDHLVGKDELIDALWPRQAITEANLTQTVYRTRQALGDSATHSRWIETVPRIGYRFVGEIEPVDPSHDSSSLRSVAVLPFTGSEEADSPPDWSLSLTETLFRVLSVDPQLEVRPLSAVLHVNRRRSTEALKALRVDVVIEGSISKRSDSMRVVANLLDGRNGKLMWSKAWTLGPDEEGPAQPYIAREIHKQIGSSAMAVGNNPEPADPEVPEARAAYLRGRYCWHQFTEASLRRSIELFDRALALSPRSAPSRAWRSAAWAALGNIGAITPRESAEHARRDADRAIATDDRLAEGFEMRGVVELYFDWNLEAALRSFDRAIERDPESANAHHLRGNALAFSGNFNAALLSLQRAELIDPTSLITLTDIGLVKYLAGRFDEAREHLEAVLAQNEHFSHARLKLAFALAALDQPQKALQHVERIQNDGSSNCLAEWSLFCGLAGRLDEARAALRTIAKKGLSSRIDPYSIALAHLGAEEHQSALAALEKAIEYRSRQLVLLATDPIWSPLRSDPGFHLLNAQIDFLPSDNTK